MAIAPFASFSCSEGALALSLSKNSLAIWSSGTQLGCKKSRLQLRPVRCKNEDDLGEVPKPRKQQRRRKSLETGEEEESVGKRRQGRKKDEGDEAVARKTTPKRRRKKEEAELAPAEVGSGENVVKKTRAPRRRVKAEEKLTALKTEEDERVNVSVAVSSREEVKNECVDEDEEEEEEEDEEDEGYESEVVPQTEVEFPKEECYALVSSYKKEDMPPPLSNDELWWSWKKPDPSIPYWSEFQIREGEPAITLAAMTALTGQIKLFGDTPSVAEASLYRARRFIFYEERLAAEAKRRKEIGPMAYYKEWVKAWDKDTSKEAVQKHYEETGEDIDIQLQNMLSCQTREEYRYMIGTDIRIKRDPLVMRATRDMKRSVYGGDPVYPTVNYIQDPDKVVDYRGPDYHEPRMTVCEYLKKCGRMKTRAEHAALMIKQKQQQEEAENEGAGEIGGEEMATAIDIGEEEDGEDDEDSEEEDEETEALKKDGVQVKFVPPEQLTEIPDEEK